jgi:hypothetical protein
MTVGQIARRCYPIVVIGLVAMLVLLMVGGFQG